jgi:hypothetical protein
LRHLLNVNERKYDGYKLKSLSLKTPYTNAESS